MSIFDKRIEIKAKPFLDSYLRGFNYETSGLSFTSLYMWRDINQFTYELIGDYLCLSGYSHLEMEEGVILPFLFPPLTKTGTYDGKKLRETIAVARKKFDEAGYPFSIRLVPTPMLPIFKEAYPGPCQVIDDRPNYDYLYRKQDLIALKGREYHSKKNHLNHFKSHYSYTYEPMTSAMSEEAMKFIEEFNRKKEILPHERVLLEMEERAMRHAFDNLEVGGYVGGVIRINNKIAALTLGGLLSKDTMVVHVEKADTKYRGLYQAINQEFCAHMGEDIQYVNREEDMGLLNLRKAKLSYKPLKLVEKHIICCE